MVDRRIKSYQQQVEEIARRVEQRRVYRRNQIFGLLMVAAAIFIWWVAHTRRGWIFPAGWWHF